MVETEKKEDDLFIDSNNIGISFLEEKTDEETSQKKEEVIQNDDSKENPFNKGNCKVQYNKAIESYEKDLSINPQDTISLNKLALLYKKVGNFNKSDEAIDKLLVLEPENEEFKKIKY